MTQPQTESIRLTSPEGASAEISLHGANLLSWKTPDGQERLFLSSLAEFGEGSAIRGGVPVIFPQFGGPQPLRHGFARTSIWELVSQSASECTLQLLDSDSTRARWPHPFELQLHFTLEALELAMTLNISNRGDESFQFTGALHSYLRVANIEDTEVRGLSGGDYLDEVSEEELTDRDETIRFHGMVDRVYHEASSRDVRLVDSTSELTFASTGFQDVVVWNPGAEAAAKLKDLEPGGHQHFVCVEAVAGKPVKVNAGESWQGTQRIKVVS